MLRSGNSELEQLEDRHYRFNQSLVSWSGIMRSARDVRQHTENSDWLRPCFQAPSAEACGLERLSSLQEEFEAELAL